MKKIISTLLFLVISTVLIWAQGTAQIYFEKTTHDFGIFYEDQPKVTCKFKFTNTGDGPLVIHQAMASCGCTVPKYPKEPIRPGETGEITVTYDGTGKFPGHFRKTVTLRTNAKDEITRLIIEGDMQPASAKVQ
ncbi:MAG: DUF1573 domain-containing protein [Bacteroides sp.]|nr:DUF1573 domain-containing protein [Bacteroides sp.]